MSLVLYVALFVVGAVVLYYAMNNNKPEEVKVEESVPKKKESGKRKPKKVDKTANMTKSQKVKKAPVVAIKHESLMHALRGHTEDIGDMAISACGRLVCTVSSDKTIRIFTPNGDQFDKKTKNNYCRLNLSAKYGSACAFSADSKFLAVAMCPQQTVEIYSIAVKDNRVVATLAHSFDTGHKNTITSLVFGGNSSYIMTTSKGQDTSVKVWKPKGQLIKELNTKQMVNHTADVSRDGRFLSVATRMAEAKIWEFMLVAKTGSCLGVDQVMTLKGHKRGLNGVSFAECFDYGGCAGVATACVDGTWRFYDLNVQYKSNEEPRVVSKQESGFPSVDHIAVAPKKNGLVALAHGSTVQLNKRSGEVVATFEAHKGEVQGLMWFGNGTTLASFGADKSVRLWTPKEA